MLGNQNGLATAFQLIQEFSSLSLKGCNQFSAQGVTLKYHI